MRFIPQSGTPLGSLEWETAAVVSADGSQRALDSAAALPPLEEGESYQFSLTLPENRTRETRLMFDAGGLEAAVHFARCEASFYSANDQDSVVYFAHCISRTGSYLSQMAGVPEGTAMAYLIAPPLEALYGLDAALKMADVELNVFYGPPTETNFAGGLLTGAQAACEAACDAFARAVCAVAAAPIEE